MMWLGLSVVVLLTTPSQSSPTTVAEAVSVTSDDSSLVATCAVIYQEAWEEEERLAALEAQQKATEAEAMEKVAVEQFLKQVETLASAQAFTQNPVEEHLKNSIETRALALKIEEAVIEDGNFFKRPAPKVNGK